MELKNRDTISILKDIINELDLEQCKKAESILFQRKCFIERNFVSIKKKNAFDLMEYVLKRNEVALPFEVQKMSEKYSFYIINLCNYMRHSMNMDEHEISTVMSRSRSTILRMFDSYDEHDVKYSDSTKQFKAIRKKVIETIQEYHNTHS